MSPEHRLSQLKGTLSNNLPHLSKPQAGVLALWCFGVALSGTIGLSTVSFLLGSIFEFAPATMQQRLREWYLGAEYKRGKQRVEVDVSECFPCLLRWIFSLWDCPEKQICLVMDATALGNRFAVLCISVVYRGCAIPIAWKVLPAQEPGEWQCHWLKLLTCLEGVIPSDWLVVVMTDRGLYADWLFKKIAKMGWHPFMRLKSCGKYRVGKGENWQNISKLADGVGVGKYWAIRVDCFKSKTLKDVTLLIARDEGYAEAWIIVTTLPPTKAHVTWYSLRSWIECGFKDLKRGGWQWQYTRLKESERVDRQWLVLSVTTLLLLAQGEQDQDEVVFKSPLGETFAEEKTIPILPARQETTKPKKGKRQKRKLSCFRQGFLQLLAAIVRGESWMLRMFKPEDWPLAMKHSMTLLENLTLEATA